MGNLEKKKEKERGQVRQNNDMDGRLKGKKSERFNPNRKRLGGENLKPLGGLERGQEGSYKKTPYKVGQQKGEGAGERGGGESKLGGA